MSRRAIEIDFNVDDSQPSIVALVERLGGIAQ
jgi:hypothetical protein